MVAGDAREADALRGRRRASHSGVDVLQRFGLGGGGRQLLEFADRVPLVIVGLDKRGFVTYANPAMHALCSADESGIEGADGLRWLFGDEYPRPLARYVELLAGRSAEDFETEVTGARGRPRTIGWHTVPLHSDQGEVIGSLSIGVDLTARLRWTRAREAVETIERSILRGRPVAELEGQVCELACEVAGTAVAVLARPGAGGCEVRASAGLAVDSIIPGPIVAPWCAGEGDAAPIVLDDFELSGTNEKLGPAVMVPLAAPPTCGFLMVADRSGADPLEANVVDVIGAFARQINIALEYGSRVRELAVLEDRERIARDLHDLVIQRIFAAGLSLQVAAQMVIDQPEVAERLSEVSGVLDGAIAELRRSILGLEASEDRLLRRRVEQVVVEVTDGAELDVVVEVPGGPAGVSGTLTSHLLAALREALTNVVRHARAETVEVVVSIDDWLVLSVRDDGVGLVDAGRSGGHGLDNLGDRARQLGGAFHVETSSGGGVSLEWRVPLLPLRQG